jgi:hypothetical protein
MVRIRFPPAESLVRTYFLDQGAEFCQARRRHPALPPSGIRDNIATSGPPCGAGSSVRAVTVSRPLLASMPAEVGGAWAVTPAVHSRSSPGVPPGPRSRT